MSRRPMFTAEEVAEMRRRIDSKEISVTELAKEKQTTRQTIHSVLKRREKVPAPAAPALVQAKAPRVKKEKPVIDFEDIENWLLYITKEAKRARRLENELALCRETIREKQASIDRL